MLISNHICTRLFFLTFTASNILAISAGTSSTSTDIVPTGNYENRTLSLLHKVAGGGDIYLQKQRRRTSGVANDTTNVKNRLTPSLTPPASPPPRYQQWRQHTRDLKKRVDSDEEDNGEEEEDGEDNNDNDADDDDYDSDASFHGEDFIRDFNSYPTNLNPADVPVEYRWRNYVICISLVPDWNAACGSSECIVGTMWGCNRAGEADLAMWHLRMIAEGTPHRTLPQDNPRLARHLPDRTSDSDSSPEDFCREFARCYCHMAEVVIRIQEELRLQWAGYERPGVQAYRRTRFPQAQYTLGADSTSFELQYFPFWEKRHSIPGFGGKKAVKFGDNVDGEDDGGGLGLVRRRVDLIGKIREKLRM